MEQKKYWDPELLDEKSDRFQTLRNNMQQGGQTDATYNIQQFWELLANNVASVWLHVALHSASVKIMPVLNY